MSSNIQNSATIKFTFSVISIPPLRQLTRGQDKISNTVSATQRTDKPARTDCTLKTSFSRWSWKRTARRSGITWSSNWAYANTATVTHYVTPSHNAHQQAFIKNAVAGGMMRDVGVWAS